MRRNQTFRQLSAALSAAFLATVVTCCPALADQLFVDPMFGYSVTSNVQYGTGVRGNATTENLLMDIYQPTGLGLPAVSPAIVLMHGGGFFDGDKTSGDMEYLAQQFAMRGYVAVSIDYRLMADFPPPPGAPLSVDLARVPGWVTTELNNDGITIQQYADEIAAAVSDQATAVNFLAANAGTYHIDPGAIAIGGFSAGAVSSQALGAGAVDGVSADVGAVLSISGGLFGAETAIDSSDPGMLLLHGTADTTVPYSEAGYTINALATAGVPYETLILPGVGHDAGALLNAMFANPDPYFQFLLGQLQPVPEPATLWLLLPATMALLIARRRSRRRDAGN